MIRGFVVAAGKKKLAAGALGTKVPTSRESSKFIACLN